MIHIVYRRDYRTCTACQNTQCGALMRVVQIGDEIVTLCEGCAQGLARELGRPERKRHDDPIRVIDDED